MKLLVLSIYSIKDAGRWPITVLMLAAVILGALPEFLQAGQPRQSTRRVIVLDPGHGGHDTGAKGENGIYEKDVALTFARILANTLEPAYSVRLTRADDYQLAPINRSALANHLGADLFISLHTGASVLHNPNGMLIAFNEHRFVLETGDNDEDSHAARAENAMAKSRLLAEILGTKLRHNDRALNVDILGMPLIVLQGADLPSLLVEIGYITNPANLEMLQDNAQLTKYAEIIAAGLDTYFSEPTR